MSSMPSWKSVSFATALVAALASCGGPTGADNRDAALQVTADLAGTAVATVVVEVTAPDIATPLVFNIPIANQIASGSITIPAGAARTISIDAFDAGGVKTHSGSVTLNVAPGTHPTVQVVLQPLTGDVPINVTLGAFTVTVAPAQVTLTVGSTAPLTATIMDWNGNPIVGTVDWATHDPGKATVDAAGLVTATGAGSTTISAMYHGATAVATVTVTP